jgi:LacI family repressor for deo operon, udp, cdd, tsx, nupC, and nupG
VLSNAKKVAPSTRARVNAAIEATGYTINFAARTLRARTSQSILVAMPNIGNPFYSAVLEGVVHEAASRGYVAMLVTRLSDDPTKWLRDYLQSHRADGLLLFDAALQLDALAKLPSIGDEIPLVLSSDDIPNTDYPIVMTDNRESARFATLHLIGLGHTKIAYLSGKRFGNLISERETGFFKAMNENELRVRKDWLFDGDFTLASGVAAARKMINLDEMPTGVFCANDDMALGLISELLKFGIECPRDISVVGFDDIQMSRHYTPSLTTVRQPRAELGRTAAATLLNMIELGAIPASARRTVLRNELVVRNSTRPIV